MYARGMTTREIQGHLEEMYGIEVSPTLISNVTDAVVEEVKQWQNRPLEELYPILYLDALMVSITFISKCSFVDSDTRAICRVDAVVAWFRVCGIWKGFVEGKTFRRLWSTLKTCN
jgi:hypothetical protein